MTALANGTYFISSILGGGDRFYLGFSSGATREALVINSFTGLESHQVHAIELSTKAQESELSCYLRSGISNPQRASLTSIHSEIGAIRPMLLSTPPYNRQPVLSQPQIPGTGLSPLRTLDMCKCSLILVPVEKVIVFLIMIASYSYSYLASESIKARVWFGMSMEVSKRTTQQ